VEQRDLSGVVNGIYAYQSRGGYLNMCTNAYLL
jgi:hypothetical protein